MASASKATFPVVSSTSCSLAIACGDIVVWIADRVVQLETERPVQKADTKYLSNVFLLKPTVEAEIRLRVAAIGGALNHHFVESSNKT